MKPALSEQEFQGFWNSLLSDENYPGLADYVMQKNADLHADLSALRNDIYQDIPPEKLEVLDGILVELCHPPPGCKGFTGSC